MNLEESIVTEEVIFAKITYQGKLVEEGFMDARKAGLALLGIDESLKYFIHQESSDLKNIDFEIPVRIRKGSWETIFLENLDELLIKTAFAWGASKYFGSALSEMAKKDFKDIGFKDIFKKAFKGMSWVVKIACHMGSLTKKEFTKINFDNKNDAVIENDNGEKLVVPPEYLELFSNCPDSLFTNLANIIEEERELLISYTENKKIIITKIDSSKKGIFISSNDDDEILFPELQHDQYVELEGHITRGNENANTIGLLYKKHILTCYPRNGNINKYKNVLFSNCIVKGFVDRLDKKNKEIIENRPRIKFISIVPKEDTNKQSNIIFPS